MQDIHDYVAQDSPSAAGKVVAGIYERAQSTVDINYDKINDCTLALLYLVTCDLGERVRKSFDLETMNRLHDKGYIGDPKGKDLSVVLTDKGYARARELFESLFAN